jgi:hypothetical protein
MRDSPQPLVHLEAAVLQMATLEPGETLARLLQRLDALERKSGGDGGAPAPGGAAPGGARTGSARAPVGTGTRSAAPAPPQRFAPRAAPSGYAAPARSRRPRRHSRRPRDARPARPRPGATLASTQAAVAGGREPDARRDDAIDQCWRDALGGVNGVKRMLGAFLEESQFMGLEGETLVLAMDDLHRTVVEEKENRALLDAEVRRAFGRSLALRCVPPGRVAKAAPAVADVRPLVDQAIAWFQGDVIERGARAEQAGE